MTKKLVLLINRYTNETLYTNSQIDLARLLEVSVSTVKRKYTKPGKYESMVYTFYTGIEKYENNKIKKYRHDVKPPIRSNGNSDH